MARIKYRRYFDARLIIITDSATPASGAKEYRDA